MRSPCEKLLTVGHKIILLFSSHFTEARERLAARSLFGFDFGGVFFYKTFFYFFLFLFFNDDALVSAGILCSDKMRLAFI